MDKRLIVRHVIAALVLMATDAGMYAANRWWLRHSWVEVGVEMGVLTVVAILIYVRPIIINNT